MRHFKVTFRPDDKVVDIHEGAVLVEAANKAGIILNTVCGGRGTCGKCAVELVGTSEIVYACRHKVDSDIEVRVPDKSRFYKQQILEHGIKHQIELNPCVIKDFVRLESFDNEPIREQLKKVCKDRECEIDNEFIERINNNHGQESEFTFVSHICDFKKEGKSKYKVAAVEVGDTSGKIYGVAVDIGTTTVVAKLVNMLSGEIEGVCAVDNPQAAYGADVIARITYGSEGQGLKKMHDCIIDAVNELISQVAEKAKLDVEDVYEVCVACNTTMNHIFLNFPISQLGQKPFKAYSEESHNLKASELGIKINPAGNVHTMANIAGFVGADTTAVALAVGMDKTKKMTLVMDIGTNGELILGTREKMYAASCAAGPAFEGAKIGHGSRAVDGAIQSVVINENDIDVDVIGGKKASSICGSGLIDAMAVLVELGIVDMTGRFVEKDRLVGKLPEKIVERIVELDGQGAFVLADNDEDKVYFTQKDVRETQLAKAAMRVGIVILQEQLGIKDDQIDQILLAGAFGNYIKRESAQKIDLIPKLDITKVHFVGNAASTGAVMALLSCECRQLANELAEKIVHVELADSPQFGMAYAESMMFSQG